MKIVYSYFKTFNKVIWSEKVPFFYTLILPAIIFLMSNYGNIKNGASLNQIMSTSSNYLGYMIVATAVNGVALQLINFREIGFLKTYTMISGGERKYSVWGLICSEFLFGYVCVLIFSACLMFFYPTQIVHILVVYTLTYVISALPIMFVSILADLLPVRNNTSGTLGNLLLVVLLWVSAVRVDSHSLVQEFLFGLDPCDYVTQVFDLVNRFTSHAHNIYSYQVLAVTGIFLIFLVLGIVCSSRVRINSEYMRN
ncbi:hypothetical protein LPAF129_13650 [Ligilactobacillus pabuli]|uniref:ABC-2 type transporter domain-containing protein n=1 Tax=Ligilactobacillus pabuli TaxID=2886039 RepID=A0ABQ5JI33_9LACO|nr:hypothetical protein [Ligilactobacillus pabuli]GKS81679.1 hypothetical protein LPAF129_13650 [Ligilactobacillus pabuli]